MARGRSGPRGAQVRTSRASRPERISGHQRRSFQEVTGQLPERAASSSVGKGGGGRGPPAGETPNEATVGRRLCPQGRAIRGRLASSRGSPVRYDRGGPG